MSPRLENGTAHSLLPFEKVFMICHARQKNHDVYHKLDNDSLWRDFSAKYLF